MQLKDSSKTIVCYGDSNTWGRVPKGERYPRSVRWTGVLQGLLGDDYEVVEEGLTGRTFVIEDPDAPHKTGITHLKSIIRTHRPIDLVIVMLGTNDIKSTYNLSPEDIAGHLQKTIELIKEAVSAKILVVCPPEIIVPESGKLEEKFEKGPEVSKQLPGLFQAMAEKTGCDYLNSQDYVAPSRVDGYHLDPDANKKLAEVLKEKILEILG